MDRVAGGDQEALAVLYDRYGAACYGMAKRVLRDDGLAQDVVQEVFLSLWRKPVAYDAARARFSSWLMSVAHHRSVDAVRREQQHRSRRASVEYLDWTADDTDVEAAVWCGLRRAQVVQAVEQLPARQREVLLLAYFDGLTQREVAGLLKVPLGTVKSRMFHGTAALRDRLSQLPSDDDGSR